MSRHKTRRRKYTQRVLDCAVMSAPLSEIMTIGEGELPIEVIGWFAGATLRRVRADYPNGWRLQFSINDQGYATRICASLRFVVKGIAA